MHTVTFWISPVYLHTSKMTEWMRHFISRWNIFSQKLLKSSKLSNQIQASLTIKKRKIPRDMTDNSVLQFLKAKLEPSWTICINQTSVVRLTTRESEWNLLSCLACDCLLSGSFFSRIYSIAIAIVSSREATLQELWFNGRKNQKSKTMTTAYLMLHQNRTDKFYFLKNFFSFWRIWDQNQSILASLFKGIRLYMMCPSYTFSEQMGSNWLCVQLGH